MAKLARQLSDLRRQFQQLYDPATAFGNQDLLEINAQIQDIELILETHDECRECQGWGTTECHECGHDRDCTECEDGLVKKPMQPLA